MAGGTAPSQRTANGSAVTFLEGDEAAIQAVEDLKYVAKQLGGGTAQGAADDWVAGLTAAGSLVGAVATVGLLATSIVQTVRGSQPSGDKEPQALTIRTRNMTAQPLVLHEYMPVDSWVSNALPPLAPGESDVFLLTYPDEWDAGDTKIDLRFLLGSVRLELSYAYIEDGVSDPGRWVPSLTIDGIAHSYDVNEDDIRLCGALYDATGGDDSASFSVYTSPIESGTGQIDLQFYATDT